MISSVVSKDDFISNDDLEKGYWQVKLNPAHRKYFGISLDGKYYIANVLILGICEAVFTFTKIVCPIIRFLRSRGSKILAYVDDFFNAKYPASQAIKNKNFMLFVLTNCGWAVNISKHNEISQMKVFLGLLVNSISMEF